MFVLSVILWTLVALATDFDIDAFGAFILINLTVFPTFLCFYAWKVEDAPYIPCEDLLDDELIQEGL